MTTTPNMLGLVRDLHDLRFTLTQDAIITTHQDCYVFRIGECYANNGTAREVGEAGDGEDWHSCWAASGQRWPSATQADIPPKVGYPPLVPGGVGRWSKVKVDRGIPKKASWHPPGRSNKLEWWTKNPSCWGFFSGIILFDADHWDFFCWAEWFRFLPFQSWISV